MMMLLLIVKRLMIGMVTCNDEDDNDAEKGVAVAGMNWRELALLLWRRTRIMVVFLVREGKIPQCHKGTLLLPKECRKGKGQKYIVKKGEKTVTTTTTDTTKSKSDTTAAPLCYYGS
jgi:hypothetical protein